MNGEKCITGQSKSGVCGSAAYCTQPHKCCSECKEDCNIRCGWISEKRRKEERTQPEGRSGLDSLLDQYGNIVFFDTETTGFDAQKNQIIELAAIGVRRNFEGKAEIWKEMDVYCRLPDGQKIPEKIVELTGITDETLETEGVTETEMAERFAEIMEGDPYRDFFDQPQPTLLIAHNAQFDLNFATFLYVRLMHDHRQWLAWFRCSDYLDTLTVYKDRAAYPHKLANAIEHYGLQDRVVNSHRAIDDVKALLEVTKAMGAERDDLPEYVNVFGYNPKYSVSGRLLKKVTYVAQGFRNGIADPGQILPRLAKRGDVK